MLPAKKYSTDHAVSSDGVRIGYRQLGKGEPVILLHGGMMSAQNLMKLGELMAADFQVIIPDRRGRASSQHGIPDLAAESADLQAVADKTKARSVYGLSAGAVIVLQTAVTYKRIEKMVLHEPPLFIRAANFRWIDDYEAAMRKEDYGKAFTSIIKGTDDPSSLLNRLPRFISAPLFDLSIKAEAKKHATDSDNVTLKMLLTAMAYDIQVVKDSAAISTFARDLETAVLLLKGGKSQLYLKDTINELNNALPGAVCKEFPKYGHTVSDNGGQPDIVAAELRRFFYSLINPGLYT